VAIFLDTGALTGEFVFPQERIRWVEKYSLIVRRAVAAKSAAYTRFIQSEFPDLSRCLEMISRISSMFHTVTLGLSFIGRGYIPDLTPAHQVLLQTGIIGGMGGSALGLPTIWDKRT
jgi:hypothetical protein